MSFSSRFFIFYFLFFIDSFSIANCQSLDTSFVVIDSINIIGNKNTKQAIVCRELNFKVGDTIDANVLMPLLQRAKENILNTSLFNFVEISSRNIDSVHVTVNINLWERWYVWPMPIFELADRNFNEWWLTKDFLRTNYGINLMVNNCRGRNETLSLLIRAGYSQKYSISYSIPYFSKKKIGGLSCSIFYLQNHEIVYSTFANKLQYFKDINQYARKEISSTVQYFNRQGLYNKHTFTLGYKKNEVADTVAVLNQDYFLNKKTSQKYVSFSYWFRRDCRDIAAYPLRGYYYDFEIVKKGLGLIHDDVDLLYLTASCKKFWQLFDRVFFASSVTGKLSTNSPQSYFNMRGLGYGSDYVRSYEYYVIDGQNFALMKTNLKYQLLRPHVAKTNVIPLEKFNTVPYACYINLFADMAYVQDKQYYATNPLTNTLLIGGGIGFDYVTYYSIVARIEYAINKFGERDIFLHVTLPI